MIDPLNAGMTALTAPSPIAFLLLLLAGLLTSIGPCIAPRYVAVAAIVHSTERPARVITAFVFGLISAYVFLGFAAGALGMLIGLAGAMNTVLAGALVIGGMITLAQAGPKNPEHAHAHHEHQPICSIGGTFLLGATSALVVSPCCTPVVATIIATSSAIGRPITGALSLGIFALGHTLPIVAAAFAGSAFRRLALIAASQAPGIVAGALMLALGVYYGILA